MTAHNSPEPTHRLQRLQQRQRLSNSGVGAISAPDDNRIVSGRGQIQIDRIDAVEAFPIRRSVVSVGSQ
jgi:hypothetical protein